jgi:hypothetical protein
MLIFDHGRSFTTNLPEDFLLRRLRPFFSTINYDIVQISTLLTESKIKS